MVIVRICEDPLNFGHEAFVFEQQNIKSVAHLLDLTEKHSLCLKDEGIAFV